MYGWIGCYLRIDLGSGTVRKESLPADLARKYLGGRGLGTHFMMTEVDPKIDPLDQKNKLIFAAGPLSGTNAPSASHFDAVSKGPLNGTIAASSSGGIFGPMLKYAGYDMIILEGKSVNRYIYGSVTMSWKSVTLPTYGGILFRKRRRLSGRPQTKRPVWPVSVPLGRDRCFLPTS